MKKMILFLLIAPVLCGCSGSAPAPIRDTESGAFVQSGVVTEEASIPVEALTNDEKPFSVSGENTSSPDESGTDPRKYADSIENAYASLLPFSPDDPEIGKIMTEEEVLAGFHDYKNQFRNEECNLEAIAWLMNMNAFLTDTYIFQHTLSFDFSDLNATEWTALSCDYFQSLSELEEMLYTVYEKPFADYIISQNIFSEKEGKMILHYPGNWTYDVFRNQTYIRIDRIDDNECEFTWFYPDSSEEGKWFIEEKKGLAVCCEGKWKLAYMLYANPEISIESYRELIAEEASVSEETASISEKPYWEEIEGFENVGKGDSGYFTWNDGHWCWVEELVVPENWREVLTTEEAFERFDEITAPLPEGASLEDALVLLMNRNILCFSIGHLETFEFIDSTLGLNYSGDEALHIRARSEYVSTIQEIENLEKLTYTEEYAYVSFYGTEDRPRQEFIKDEDGVIWIDMRCVGNWVNDPFRDRSYIEIIDRSESLCEFLWHYFDYEHTHFFSEDWESHDFYPVIQEIHGFAMKENGEWRLAYTIYNNPELDRPTFKWRPDAAEHE